MLRIGLVDDEINDLLSVIENLVTFDPLARKIGIVPVLLSRDSEASVTKQSAWRKKELTDVLASKGNSEFSFPIITLLGPLDTGKEDECARILDYFAQQTVDVIISDSSMGEEMAGILLLNAALSDPRWADYKWQCWLTTKWERVAKTIHDFRWRGKFDPYARYLNKKAIIDSAGSGECNPELLVVVESAIQQIEASSSVAGRESFGVLVGKSRAMNGKGGVYERIEAYARNRNSSVFICGLTGTGKELVAREIHDRSGKKGSFVAYNCARFNNELMESDLFGHKKGAFTGAIASKTGLFEQAIGGTLFFDEIGEIPFDIQGKLLRVLEERKLCRMGDFEVQVDVSDVRVISATNKNIPEMIENDLFRADLYYRLSVLNIEIPPLSERLEDIPLLVGHFVRQFNELNGRHLEVSDEALEILNTHHWPGNARDLRNCIERAFALTQGDEITADNIHFSKDSGKLLNQNSPAQSAGSNTNSPVLLEDCMNKSSAEILALITERRLVVELAKLKRELGEGNFVQLLKLIQGWTHEKYHREYLPDTEAKAMFGMDGKNYRQRMYQYKQKYGI
jgi:DNA-binding NtrC family response regulator